MKTELIEFINQEKQKLRGILSSPDDQIQKLVICLHGFERCASTEKKFTLLSDRLAQNGSAVLRLDFLGCGLSDGDFRLTTIDRQAEDLVFIFKEITKQLQQDKISVFAHSLGACVLARTIDELQSKIDKVVLIAPALNQKDLMRYWFVSSENKKTGSKTEITWENYRQYLDETSFQEDCKKTNKMVKSDYIDSKYFLENKDLDFSSKFDGIKNKVLHIHGSKDTAVPIQSLNVIFDHQIIIPEGDHDLEKPNYRDKWLVPTIEFLVK
jgi:pimeloyl-ACP methyl ester carboxylesterase